MFFFLIINWHWNLSNYSFLSYLKKELYLHHTIAYSYYFCEFNLKVGPAICSKNYKNVPGGANGRNGDNFARKAETNGTFSWQFHCIAYEIVLV